MRHVRNLFSKPSRLGKYWSAIGTANERDWGSTGTRLGKYLKENSSAYLSIGRIQKRMMKRMEPTHERTVRTVCGGCFPVMIS